MQEQLDVIEEEVDGNDDEANESVDSIGSDRDRDRVNSSNESEESEEPPEVPLEGPVSI